MQQQMKITFDGAELDFSPPKMADLVAFERSFGVKASVLEPKPTGEYDEDGKEIVAADVALEWMAFLVWRSLRRQGAITKDTPFDDDFLERIDDVQLVAPEEGADQDPSVPDQPPG